MLGEAARTARTRPIPGILHHAISVLSGRERPVSVRVAGHFVKLLRLPPRCEFSQRLGVIDDVLRASRALSERQGRHIGLFLDAGIERLELSFDISKHFRPAPHWPDGNGPASLSRPIRSGHLTRSMRLPRSRAATSES